MKIVSTLKLFAVAMVALSCLPVAKAGFKYEDGDVKFGAGGRMQLQYHQESEDGESSEDELFFRRLRFYIDGTTHEDWYGKWQVDFGKSKISVKDAYFQYKGVDGIKISLGNKKVPFSREYLTSSKKQEMVERSFVGDHNYGVADRQAGIHLEGSATEFVSWKAFAGLGAQDPDNKKLDFESTIQIDGGDDWSEGPMVAGRLELFPLGKPAKFKYEQGDFKGTFIPSIAVGVFQWSNDDDNLSGISTDEETGEPDLGKQDVDNVNGVELSVGLRGYGVSLDAQVNIFNSELSDADVTDGLYVDSETELTNFAVEGGYMINNMFEPILGYEIQDADGYSTEWTRISYGAAYYLEKHDIKLQATFRQNSDKDGKDGNDVDEVFVQAQYVF